MLVATSSAGLDPEWLPCIPQQFAEDPIPTRKQAEESIGCLGRFAVKGFDGPRIALSPDGRSLFVGESQGRLLCWDLNSGNLRWEISNASSNWICSVSISRQGDRVAVACGDGLIRVFDASSGRLQVEAKGHLLSVYGVDWSPDGHWLVSGGRDGLRVWDAQTGACSQHRGGKDDDAIFGVNWSPKGRFVAACGANEVVPIWDVESWDVSRCFSGKKQQILCVNWAPDGQRLLGGSRDRLVRSWDISSDDCAVFRGHKNYINDVTWSPDGQCIASASDDRTVRVWDVATQEELARFEAPENNACSLAWAPTGGFLVSSHYGSCVRFWDVRQYVKQKSVTVGGP